MKEGEAGSRRPKALLVCGPSGVGKGTLIKRLLDEHPDKFGFSCSHTTRKPREGEAEGTHYHFVERDDMLKDIEDGKFLEFAHVSSNIYGTSFASVKKVIEEQKKCCVLDIDMQGAEQVHEDGSIDKVGVFIMPPSFEVLEGRLRGRGTESEKDIQIRLETAKAELEFGNSNSIFDFKVVNESLEEAYAKFKEIALIAYTGGAVSQ
ncbi:guanylate kinase [Chloropicon primus]|uniref:Guanylate kinase 1 n=1 Tax=Chloropicon primus TaxID=1764295 RepID=A0A5B8MH32_9CHLO|nr:guanylate kinase [Chloropicon primus]UPQ97878.1 guanylate kinase [Chloropicon primus]|mmetsp:Transcript_14143/g.40071  ORF Transcript_14143/g.40071 Transcript_14143/m.40071 type:complete len:206 (+) Transcript_14143:77-694(+)|eukprot:QDZ18670.1 guanylate kinase [Chloropicon primus]